MNEHGRLANLTKILLLAFLVFIPAALFSQVAFKVPVTITDMNGKTGTIWVGISPNATGCAGSVVAFGPCDTVTENEVPPLPPSGVFDCRSGNTNVACVGNGMLYDIHPYVSPTQVETFYMFMQSSPGGFPFILSWPSGLGAFCDSMKLQDAYGGVIFNFNMLASDRDTLPPAYSTIPQPDPVNIVVYGPKASAPIPADPTLVSPPNGETNENGSVTVSWDSVAGATKYHLVVSTDPSFKSSVFAQDTSGLTTRVTGLSAGKLYYWEVQSESPFMFGCYSASGTFVTVPSLLAPVQGGVVDTNSQFSWQSGSGVSEFEFQLSLDNFTTVLKDTTVSTNTITVSGLLPCYQYYWKVRAVSTLSQPNFSAVQSFSVQQAVPAVPVLGSPSNDSTGLSPTPTLNWTGNVCTQTFHLQVATDTGFTHLVFDKTLTGTSQKLGTLIGQTNYYWHVADSNSAGASSYSSWRVFTTVLLPPGVPVQVAPAQNDTVTSLTPVLVWNTSTNNPATYHVQVDTNVNFAHPFVDSAAVADTSITLPLLAYCSKYVWRVRAQNAAGSSQYSDTLTFRTQTVIPSPPILISPANYQDSVQERTSLSWKGADPCTHSFIVQMSKDSNFAAVNIIINDTTSSMSLPVGPLSSLTTYFWRVYAIGQAGVSTPQSGRFTITALTSPDPVNLLSPSNGIPGVGINPIMMWDSSARAQTYQFQLALDSAFKTLLYNDTALTDTFQQVGPLPNNTIFYWRVRSKNSVGTGMWSPVWNFATLAPPPAPILLMPVNDTTYVSPAPLFVWALSDGGVSYDLEVATDSLFANTVFSDTSTLTQTSQELTSALKGKTRYYWHVRSRDGAGWGPFSVTWTFVTTPIGIPEWTLPIAVAETGPERDTIYMGIDQTATFGVDPSLGEYELPPPAFGDFDVRFINIPTRPGLIGQGLRLDYEPFTSYTQVDTFQIAFQPGIGSYPMRVSWTAAAVRQRCDSMVIMDSFGGNTVRARMDSDSVVVVANTQINTLLIVMYGADPIVSGVKENHTAQAVPKGYHLYQNYPNPFNPTTKIQYSTDHSVQVNLVVYDMLGREVSVLAEGARSPGVYEVVWDGRDREGLQVSSGIYFVRITMMRNDGVNTERFVDMRKMMMMK